jgi:Flp pilus assembly protein TadD
MARRAPLEGITLKHQAVNPIEHQAGDELVSATREARMRQTASFGKIIKLALCVGFVSSVWPSPAAADVVAIARKQRTAIEGALSEPHKATLRNAAAASPSGAAAESYGHAFLMRRQLAPAAWMFATAVERAPGRSSAVTALGVILTAGAAGNGKSVPSAADLAAAVELQREAVRLMPKEGVTYHNLGTALLRLAQARGNDRALLKEAVKSLRKAVRLGGHWAPHFYVRLAEALKALRDSKGAEDALQKAFAINPADPVLLVARQSTLADVPVHGNSNICKVDFNCRKNCPGGITGRVMMVTCMIANSSAVSDCTAGRPYPKAYNCERELPRFGILIPGLDPGFSIITPWGSIDVIQQGNGRIDWQAKFNSPPVGGLQAFVGAKGSYNPPTGAMNWSFNNGGVQFNVLDNNVVMKHANMFNVGASAVVRYDRSKNRVKVGLDAGRGPLLSY